jgi:hypothetical protein
MRSTGELLYLLMVIGAFTIFAIALAWAERTWRPAASRESADSKGTLPHAAE